MTNLTNEIWVKETFVVAVVASLFVVAVVVGVQPFVAVKEVGSSMAMMVAVAVLAQQFVPTEAVPVGLAMVVAMVRVVAVLPQQFLPVEVLPIGVGVAVAEMVERYPLTLVVFLVESASEYLSVKIHIKVQRSVLVSFSRPRSSPLTHKVIFLAHLSYITTNPAAAARIEFLQENTHGLSPDLHHHRVAGSAVVVVAAVLTAAAAVPTAAAVLAAAAAAVLAEREAVPDAHRSAPSPPETVFPRWPGEDRPLQPGQCLTAPASLKNTEIQSQGEKNSTKETKKFNSPASSARGHHDGSPGIGCLSVRGTETGPTPVPEGSPDHGQLLAHGRGCARSMESSSLHV
ncbi:uncharacterized protein [Miscanthus floridulus]|uniref:uncharacterized protein n=1 Tax=Miscanthus floridulus TaxID=154761 RepID=UPI00345940BC